MSLLQKLAIVYLSMLLHEFGHITVALASRCKLRKIRFTPLGYVCEFENLGNTKSSLLIYAAGPAVNLCLAAFAKFLDFDFIVIANAFLFAVNLAPAVPLDGGRILGEVLARRFGIVKVYLMVHRSSVIVSTIFIALGILQLIFSGYNCSLLLIGLYIQFYLKKW